MMSRESKAFVEPRNVKNFIIMVSLWTYQGLNPIYYVLVKIVQFLLDQFICMWNKSSCTHCLATLHYAVDFVSLNLRYAMIPNTPKIMRTKRYIP